MKFEADGRHQHHENGNHNCDGHDRDVVGHSNRGNDAVDGEHQIEDYDLA